MSALFLFAASAFAAYPGEVRGCLDRLDVGCADSELSRLGADTSTDPGVVAALAQTRFQQGRYPEAYEAMSRAVELGYADRWEELPLYQRTLYATANWVEERDGRFVVRFRPGVDAMLWRDALNAAKASNEHIAPLLGGPPPGSTYVELYPDGRSFIAASSLKAEDVYTTGVVGLAKWGKLLVTSPRALPRGYSWQDTIAHEYIHLVVAHHSADRAPVWLQEAIAKYLDGRWRDGQDRFRLSVRQQGLLAEAIQTDDLVSFDEMHPSLAKLPTAERAALAYAQLATLMQFCFERGGEQVLLRTLPAVARGTDPRDALSNAVGATSFDELMKEWTTWISAQPLVKRRLDEMPVVLDGGDDMDLDPTLAGRKDLARFVTLGDILREAGEVEAALVEYQKAVPEEEPVGPVLSNRIAQANLQLGKADQALEALEASLKDYPEFSLTHKTLGTLHLGAGRHRAARDALVSSVAINPFDPEVHQGLIRAYKALGDDQGVEVHEAALRIRRRGGDDVDRAPIHSEEGEYELPSYDQHAASPGEQRNQLAEKWIGSPAPEFGAVDLDGHALTLSALAGKVVVLDFWATWCGPCKAVMPELSALQDELGPRGLTIVGLTDEPRGRVRGFLAKRPVSYTIGLDANQAAASTYGVSSLPTAFVIDRKGRIEQVVIGSGPSGMATLKEAVEAALEEEP